MPLFNRRFRWSVRDNPPKSPAVPFIPFDYDPQTYHAVWVRKRLPGPGAQNYAYETLALAPTTPVGYGVGIMQQIVPLEQPLYAYQAVPYQGIPTTAGTIQLAPLYDPANGYVAPLTNDTIPPLLALNNPSASLDPTPTNIAL